MAYCPLIRNGCMEGGCAFWRGGGCALARGMEALEGIVGELRAGVVTHEGDTHEHGMLAGRYIEAAKRRQRKK